ncbi:MAG: hypothetical protein U5K37_06435 [Natrialbaceae archaeon]|nr:hypothetical protein [Natrialbaceae archaeon]
MYVDKKLSGVQAVQTLSRLNRTHPGKEDTFVLDFINDREAILDAFQPYYERTTVEERMDPQHIYQLENELNAFRIYTQEEVNRFAEEFFDPANQTTEKTHGKLSSLTKPAQDRFMTSDEETQDEFRSKLHSFIKAYKFQSQVVAYEDEELEKLYTFGRFLDKELPKDAGGKRVEFDDATRAPVLPTGEDRRGSDCTRRVRRRGLRADRDRDPEPRRRRDRAFYARRADQRGPGHRLHRG